jgi:hypothetical protein
MNSPLTVVISLRPGSSMMTVCSVPDHQVDSVSHQLVAHHVDFLADHMVGPRQQVRRGDPVFHAVARSVKLALIHAGEVKHGLAQRL